MDQPVIRPAASSERRALNDLARASKSHWGYTDAELELWADDLSVSPRQIAAGRVMCALIEGRIVGFFAIERDDDAAELDHLWVVPDLIGQGLGRALFERAVQMARQAGAQQLRVVSDPNALGFYTRMGAVIVGEHESTPAGRMLPVLSVDLTAPIALNNTTS